MGARTRLGLYTLGAALVLGVLADQLRAWPPGINVLLVTAALTAGGAWLLYSDESQPAGGGRWLVLPLLFFAAAFAWRDAALLQFCNFCALGCALALAGPALAPGRCASPAWPSTRSPASWPASRLPSAQSRCWATTSAGASSRTGAGRA